MAADPEETTIIRLLESLGQINTGAELISWVANDLQSVFPHGAFLCSMGKVHRAGVSPIKFYSSNFPVEYFRELKHRDSPHFSDAIRNWLESGEAQLLDSRAVAHAEAAWLERFRASGLQNIAAHGAFDFARHHVSYFSFHQIPEPLGERHRSLLNIFVPSMHIALLRILHNIKAQASLLPARKNRALTPRELEVLTWVCEGKTSTEIAAILGIARSTVRNQIQSILVKLRVNTRAQAAAKAIKKGLVIPHHPDSQFGGF